MSAIAPNPDTAAVLETLRAYHTAMVEADVDRLGELLGAGFTLGHITGYVQPKNEWFGVLRSGEFDYHRIDVDQAALSVRVGGNTAVADGKGVFNATISGMHAPWRLQFSIAFNRHGDGWKIASARYTRF
jgi:hypothetical protein